jgi:hypothetical protein
MVWAAEVLWPPAKWEGRALLGQAGALIDSWCPSLLPMKAWLTLLSLLGKLQDPPVPKPRGTPKLSERYVGPALEALVLEWGSLGPEWG